MPLPVVGRIRCVHGRNDAVLVAANDATVCAGTSRPTATAVSDSHAPSHERSDRLERGESLVHARAAAYLGPGLAAADIVNQAGREWGGRFSSELRMSGPTYAAKRSYELSVHKCLT